ncbi:MAG: hypothetical protein QXQ66_07805 [Candidatus Hadarchaeum sp.]
MNPPKVSFPFVLLTLALQVAQLLYRSRVGELVIPHPCSPPHLVDEPLQKIRASEIRVERRWIPKKA